MANTAASEPRLGANYFRLFSASVASNLGDGIALIAYPWLASAITRSGFLIALVAVAQRLPWLVVSLPAGVITDRVDRRTIMIWASAFRAVLTLAVALVVLQSSGLPSPAQIELGGVAATNWPVYVLLIASTLLLGTAEVLYDNTAQTVMPSVVDDALLEKANGRLWSTEQVANTLVGPVIGAALLGLAFVVPFAVDAATFMVAAVLIATMRFASTPRKAKAASPVNSWSDDLKEGVRWLWNHDFLRPLAIILGTINMFGTMSTATLVLFAQEVLNTSPTEFALMSTGGAFGGIVSGWTASAVSKRIGAGPSLWLTIIIGGLTMIVSGLTSSWLVVWLMFAAMMFVAVLWNVITVSLRQSIIPDELLGRVNSVYRFFAWGMMPIGSLLAGITIALTEIFGSRELALRMPWLISGVLYLAVIFYAGPKLTNETIAEAKAEAVAG